MKVYVTLTSVKKGDTTVSFTGDQHLEITRFRAYSGPSALLAIQDMTDGTIYQTDFAYASAVTALAAAPNSGGFTVLT